MADAVNLAAEFAPPETATPDTSTDNPNLAQEFSPPSDTATKSEHELNQEAWANGTPADRLKLLLSHPWDKYVKSVDEAFHGVDIPRVTAPEGEGVVKRAEQVGAGVTNVATGFVGGAISPGGLSTLVSPTSAIYSVPRFVVGGIEDIVDAYKGATSGKMGLQEVTEKGLGGALMVAGGSHVGREGVSRARGLESPEAPTTPEQAVAAIKQEVDKAGTPEAKAALEAAQVKIADKAKEGNPNLADEFQPPEPPKEEPKLADQPVTIDIQKPDGSTEKIELPASKAAELLDQQAKAAKEDVYKQAGIPPPVEAPPTDVSPETKAREELNAKIAQRPQVQFTIQKPDKIPNSDKTVPPYVQIETTSNEGRGAPLTDAERAKYPTPEEVLSTDLPTGQHSLADVQAALERKNATPPAEPAVLPKAEPPGEAPNYGISNRVNEARAKAGQIEVVPPSEGLSAEELVVRGRELLRGGADPNEVFSRFARDRRLTSDDIALVRAHGEQLKKSAHDAAEHFGENSPQYEAAAKLDSEWIRRVQPLKGAISEGMRAMQGETEIDTGTFHGIRTAFNQRAGRDFTAGEAAKAKKIVAEVKDWNQKADADVKAWGDTIAKEIPEAATKAKPKSRILEKLKARNDAAMERIAARLEKKFTIGAVEGPEGQKGFLSTDNLADLADVGAYHFARGFTKIDEWKEQMVKSVGDAVKPFLDKIFPAAKKIHRDVQNAELGDSVAGVYQRVKDYIDDGENNPNTIIAKVAADLEIPIKEVRVKLAENKTTRVVTDEMYKTLATRRQVVNLSKQWVKQQATPLGVRALAAPFSAGFKLATFGHGTVAPFTHAPMLGFNPATFTMFWRRWIEGFKLMGLRDKGAYYEQVMGDLVNDPNYITARRAGLVNDPRVQATDYEKAWVGGRFLKLGQAGNRGFDSLKLIRQDFFNQLWGKLADSQKTPELAALFSDIINHATGAIGGNVPGFVNKALFAPKLIASQVAMLVTDPAKSAYTILLKGDKATPAERTAALTQIRFLSTVVGAVAAALALNQGMLTAVGSKQKINFNDPHATDWLKFKAAHLTIAPVSGPLTVVRLLANLLRIEAGHLEGREKAEGKGGAMFNVLKDYGRSKLSPTTGLMVDVASGTDFQRRPLPFSKEKVPTFLRREGIGKYSYAEYLTTHTAPIPVSEAAREVWKHQGMDESTATHWIKALLMGAEAGAVGARVTPDYYEKKGK